MGFSLRNNVKSVAHIKFTLIILKGKMKKIIILLFFAYLPNFQAQNIGVFLVPQVEEEELKPTAEEVSMSMSVDNPVVVLA